MKTFFKISSLWLLTLAFAIISCQKGVVPTDQPNTAGLNVNDPVVQRMLMLGIKAHEIVDKGEYYVAQGDIKFNKVADPASARPSQALLDGAAVGFDKIANVTVTVDVSTFLTPAWKQLVIDATTDACYYWSNVQAVTLPNRVHLTYTSGPADIVIRRNGNFSAFEYGLGSFPSGCNPGPTIDINNNTENLTRSKLSFLIAHELGHNIGFLHTNLGSGYGAHVPFTPNTEIGSIMNDANTWGSTDDPATVPDWPGFSYGDRQAVEAVYTQYPVKSVRVAGTTPDNKKTLAFTWTSSYFCKSTIGYYVIQQPISPTSYPQVKCHSTFLQNSGEFTCPVVGSGTYRLYVYDLDDPSKTLEAFYTF